METENHTFVGPDNEVLSLAAQDDGMKRVCEVVNRDYMRGRVKHLAGEGLPQSFRPHALATSPKSLPRQRTAEALLQEVRKQLYEYWFWSR